LSIRLSGTPDEQEQSHANYWNRQILQYAKRLGFISPEGGAKDVFVHATAVEAAGLRSLAEGQRVSFDVQPDARGSKAVNLKTV